MNTLLETKPARKTPFYNWHINNKAKMINFMGWLLPLEYESSLKEAKKVRESCGVFDISHMGELIIKGKDAAGLLQYTTSNDLFSLVPGKWQYNLFLNSQAGVVDDCLIYNLEDAYMCVINAANTDKVFSYLNHYRKIKGYNCLIENKSEEISLISLQGPLSSSLIEDLFKRKIPLYYRQFSLKENLIISRSGYTGEDGFEVYLEGKKESLYFWEKIARLQKKYNFTFSGLGARDILRIEAGLPLYGQELSEEINPYEAGLGWAVKLNKDLCQGLEKVRIATSTLKKENIKKKLVGFIMQEKAMPRRGYAICNKKGEAIGWVSSGTYSPNLNKFIGMGFIQKMFLSEQEIFIKIRDNFKKARIVKLPFIPHRYRRQ